MTAVTSASSVSSPAAPPAATICPDHAARIKMLLAATEPKPADSPQPVRTTQES